MRSLKNLTKITGEYIGVSYAFLLSEHIQCKESIVIVKKFHFEILTYLYVLRAPEFIYTIFMVMYAYMSVCVCM